MPIRIIVQGDDPPHIDNYYKECPYGRLRFFVISNGNVYSFHNMWNDTNVDAKNVISDGTDIAIQYAHDLLTCMYWGVANLVEWNEFTSRAWLPKGIEITVAQAFVKSRHENTASGYVGSM